MRWLRYPLYVLGSGLLWFLLACAFLAPPEAKAETELWVFCGAVAGVVLVILGLASLLEQKGQRMRAFAWVLLIPTSMIVFTALFLGASALDSTLLGLNPALAESMGAFGLQLIRGFSVSAAVFAAGMYCAIQGKSARR